MQRLGAAALAAQVVAFLTLTFLPPQVFLFQDPVTGGFGIPPD